MDDDRVICSICNKYMSEHVLACNDTSKLSIWVCVDCRNQKFMYYAVLYGVDYKAYRIDLVNQYSHQIRYV